MIPVYSQWMDLVEKHKDLINLLKWDKNPCVELVQAFKCELNQGVLNNHGDIFTPSHSEHLRRQYTRGLCL
jgi:hypothetical protein